MFRSAGGCHSKRTVVAVTETARSVRGMSGAGISTAKGDIMIILRLVL